MRKIQWYPGHMTKAMRSMQESLSIVDGVIFVLDARCPVSSFNPKLKDMAGSKPVLYVFNKRDMADSKSDGIRKELEKRGIKTIAADSTKAQTKKDIAAAICDMTRDARERAKERGRDRTFRFMVAGVPNTGKSTLINLMAGRKRAETGNKAGVTLGKQWIRCDGFDLLDTPGTMPPDFDSQLFALRLAFVGSINDDILDLDDVSLALIEALQGGYPAALEERYGLSSGTPLEVLEAACRKRGFLQRGGEYDYERGYRAVLDDFRKGRLGKVTLDSKDDLEGIAF